jgi:hypothetical protein
MRPVTRALEVGEMRGPLCSAGQRCEGIEDGERVLTGLHPSQILHLRSALTRVLQAQGAMIVQRQRVRLHMRRRTLT